jgi:hypothetical protein
MTQQDEKSSPLHILHEILWWNMRKARIVQVVAQFKIADLLKDGPQSVKELAQQTGTNENALYRLLRACIAFGFFEEVDAGIFALNELASYLASDHPHLMYDLALQSGSLWEWSSWGMLPYSIQTGKPAFDHVHGTDFWSYMSSHTDEYSIFSRTMKALSLALSSLPALLKAYDYSAFSLVADIGGGRGTFIAPLLKTNPHLQGILFDVAPVIDDANIYIEQEGLSNRCALYKGDFFKQVPAGADAYILKSVLHDWDTSYCVHILQNVRQAMPPHAKLLVIERVFQRERPSPDLMLTDIEMLVNTQKGRERSLEEFREMFYTAGFSLTRLLVTGSTHDIIEGVAITA